MSSSPNWTPERPRMGGTRAPAPDQYVGSLLRRHGEAFARQMTLRFYERWPELEARYGQHGRGHTYEDQYWHLSTLDTAWQLGHPKLFVNYAQWLRNFLNSRGMADEIVGANFVFLRALLAGCDATAEEEEQRRALLAIVDEVLALYPEEVRQQPA